MSSHLRFRAGSKLGVSFQVSHPAIADLVRSGSVVEGTIPVWSCVGIRSIVKDHWQDKSGNWRDSIHFYEIEPAERNSRIQNDEFFLSGQFAIVRQEKDAVRALAAWKDFTAR